MLSFEKRAVAVNCTVQNMPTGANGADTETDASDVGLISKTRGAEEKKDKAGQTRASGHRTSR